MKIIAGALIVAVMTGCASAAQKMDSKRDYRDAQVEAIRVQSEQRTARETAEQLSEAAMWQSLAEAVKANPDSASHFAIVMAVAASKGGEESKSEGPMATIKTENDVTALDWAKVLTAPILSTVTQVGIASLNTSLQKEISRNNTKADIVESEQDGKIYDMVGRIVENRQESGDTTTYNVSDQAILNTGTYSDDDVYGAGAETTQPVNNGGTDGGDGGTDGGDDGTDGGGGGDDVDREIDCTEPQFSPLPLECQE